MKVLALGGAGDMGRMAVAVLLESARVSAVTMADINIKQAEICVEMIGSEKLSAVQIDINEKKKLIELIKAHDVVINTIGPFYKFEKPLVEIIIETQKPFLDICDDWKPTLDVLEMDQKAKDAGVSAVIGIGASPGITNLMAVLACSKLDDVDDLITAWGECIDIKQGKKPKYYIKPKKLRKKLGQLPEKANAAVEHLLFETLEKIPVFKNGNMVYIEPLSEIEPFAFPGFKEMYATVIGHPEPITLPRTIKANSISNVMYIGKTATDIVRQYRQKILNKKITIQKAAIALEKDFEKLEMRAKMGRAPLKEYLGGPPNLCVIGTGTKDGVPKKIAIALGRNPFGEMAGLTGVPLAIATIMMIEGKITKKGVLTPEEAITDPMDFFNRMAPYCGNNLTGKDILIERIVNL
ncbi:MAG: saccharopine dehydrogenase family protein [Candidatus Helarchaeota archaeon]